MKEYYDSVEDALQALGVPQDDRCGILLNKTENFKHFDCGSNVYDLDYYDSFWDSYPDAQHDDVKFVVEQGKPYASVVDAADKKKDAFLLIPSTRFEEALQDRSLRDKLLLVALADEEMAHYLFYNQTAGQDMQVQALSDAMFQTAYYGASQHPNLSDDWKPIREDIQKAANKLSSFGKDDFERYQELCKDAKNNAFGDYGDDFTAARGTAYTMLAGNLPEGKETNLSRGIANVILSKNYDNLHKYLDGFVRQDRKAITALEKLGKIKTYAEAR